MGLRTFCASAAMWLTGCAVVIIPPASLDHPREVYLVDHDRTSSLVLTDAQGQRRRFAYGEWNWYALGQTGLGPALRALWVKTPAALGRHVLAAGIPVAAALRQDGVEVEHLLVLHAEGRRVDQLLTQLDGYFSGGVELIRNDDVAMDFVPYPQPYWATHNSNHLVSDWLRALGFTLDNDHALSIWRVQNDHPLLRHETSTPSDP